MTQIFFIFLMWAGATEPNGRAQAALRQLRVSGELKYVDEAEAALSGCASFECRKTLVQVFLARHQNEKALELARQLNRETPDDIPTYGLVADAAIALRKYDEAEPAVQWMFDMRAPGSPAYERGALLREIWGDHSGALEFLQSAMTRCPVDDPEQKAWLLTRMAGVYRAMGNASAALKCNVQALALVPDYRPARDSNYLPLPAARPEQQQ